jgi:predicted DNA-binding transcriptional regulator YafY
MVTLGRRWYLVAWDLSRHDWRTFRVDRVVEPSVTGARFRPRELPAPDAAAFVRQQLASIPTRYDVDVVIRAAAAEVVPVTGRWAQVDPIDDESCRLRMSVDDLSWPAMLLGVIGAEFDVVSPTELTERLRRTSDLFLRSIGA